MIVQPGNGYGFSSSGYGVSLDIGNPFPAADETNQVVFLRASLSEDKVSVSPGTVNRYIPQIGSVYIDAATPPTITIEGPGYVMVKATYQVNTFFPRTATIIYHSGATVPTDTNTDGYYPLARVNEVSSGGTTTRVLTLLSTGNLVVNRLKAGANNATWWWEVVS
jgi:hypothetical protein